MSVGWIFLLLLLCIKARKLFSVTAESIDVTDNPKLHSSFIVESIHRQLISIVTGCIACDLLLLAAQITYPASKECKSFHRSRIDLTYLRFEWDQRPQPRNAVLVPPSSVSLGVYVYSSGQGCPAMPRKEIVRKWMTSRLTDVPWILAMKQEQHTGMFL
ncbi:uncharacterized protein LOC112349269 [Selaginella moellendorffii]|uniref:uncharacterized protein LOC112349269 n=1 Tax=Selaginella moellendorffii TaxID=88036 RepID=UPI000D1CCCFF|nr:uncharacterized protein LOC112349269 [Selaginella moellendorffii]|eukprot:XP_024539149.1 uncharacterized protein LOC112349269 [Selaginella moellendorffii]